MKIENLLKIEWKDLSIEIKKSNSVVYLTILTENYKLGIIANKNKFYVDDYKIENEKRNSNGS